MNGYFQIVNAPDKTTMVFYPPTDGGETVDFAEVTEYLMLKGISYDSGILYGAAKKIKEGKTEIVLNETRCMPIQETARVRTSDNKMEAIVRFYAPSTEGAVMKKEEIMNDLKYQGIVHGVMEEAIEAYIKDRRYCEDIVLAQGEGPRNGEDARIEYAFDPNAKARPTLNADGSVDFHHLNTISNCHEGDVLATLIPAVQSEPGMNVLGEIIPAKEVRNKKLNPGKNVVMNDTETQIIAQVSGHVRMENDRISVSNILELQNVDSSTGDIDFAGSVQVMGDVCENFAVKASGNVVVSGVVEGATVEAGGDVIITRGMNGMGKGVVSAGGNVIGKFFENVDITAGGYVQADSIMHCEVRSKTEVNVGGKKGFISGGHILARNSVSAKTLGSTMGTDTVVEVGADPSMKQREKDIRNTIEENHKILQNAFPVLQAAVDKIKSGGSFAPERAEYIKNLHKMYNQKKAEIARLGKEVDKIQAALEASRNACVNVTGDAYAGTRIVISDVSMIVKPGTAHCKFIKEKGDVRIKALD
ncbi:MAG: FapA family protein [Lachnospiraceae bacterium]|nr:FapA family protein [Lachnospiraceae bacterium]